jgi:hypothetical protein
MGWEKNSCRGADSGCHKANGDLLRSGHDMNSVVDNDFFEENSCKIALESNTGSMSQGRSRNHIGR